MKEQILDFLSCRPKVIAAYGYGSGVFKQEGYSSKDKPQLDLILIVDDVKEWHLENIKKNPKDYSFIGKMYFKLTRKSKLIGKTGVSYLSNILFKNSMYKYGVVDEEFFKKALQNWHSFYLPGRFHKNILEIVSTDEIRNLISENRKYAMVVSMLMSENKVTIEDLLVKLCNMSYAGDTRMAIAENPHKVLNIVKGSLKEFLNIYTNIIEKYGKISDNIVVIGKDNLQEEVKTLPKALKDYLDNTDIDINDYNSVEKYVLMYLSELNKKESTYQTLKGLKTNGLVRSLKYAAAKVGKRFRK